MTRTVIAQWTQLQRKLAGLQGEWGMQPEGNTWSPNTDVYDCNDGLVVKLELAGVTGDSIHIQVDDRALLVEGERRDPCTGETNAGNKYRQLEIEYGPFQRVIPLPYPVNASLAKARCTQGVLEIRLPKADAPTLKRISITITT